MSFLNGVYVKDTSDEADYSIKPGSISVKKGTVILTNNTIISNGSSIVIGNANNTRNENYMSFNAESFNAKSFNAESFNAKSFNAESFNAESFNAESFNAESFNAESFNAESFNAETYWNKCLTPSNNLHQKHGNSDRRYIGSMSPNTYAYLNNSDEIIEEMTADNVAYTKSVHNITLSKGSIYKLSEYSFLNILSGGQEKNDIFVFHDGTVEPIVGEYTNLTYTEKFEKGNPKRNLRYTKNGNIIIKTW
jgi:hypothetical protein